MRCSKYSGTCVYRTIHSCNATDFPCDYQVQAPQIEKPKHITITNKNKRIRLGN